MSDPSAQLPGLALAIDGVPATGEIVAGKYRVEGLLGAGGMGVVLSARHLTLGHSVAIKLLVIEEDLARAEAAERMLREARAAAALPGEHVVRVYDLGEDASGRPFIVMERLEGADLGQILRTRGTLPVADTVELVVQACRAVAEAHRAGIVHRDLKPSNLFLTRRSDGSAQVKVLDFGIAKSIRPDDMHQNTLTGARAALGSPSYMSPEQIRNARQVDTRTDVWSLGIILYELLTGRLPFEASTFMAVSAAIVADQPALPSSIRPEISPELDAIVLCCLEKDASRRFATVDELRSALLPFAGRAPAFQEVVPPSWMPDTVPTVSPMPAAPIASSSPSSGLNPVPPPSSLGAFQIDATMASAGTPRLGSVWASSPVTQRSGAPPPRNWRRISLMVAVFLAGLAVAIGLWGRAPRVESTQSGAAMFTIDSVPAGARVTESGVERGTTPLELRIERGPASSKRVFVLERPGYRSHVVSRDGRSPGPERVLIELVPEPSSSAEPRGTVDAATAGSSEVVPPTSSVRPRPAPRPREPVTPKSLETPEIRMSR